jgi:prophage tail gpP-like protein
MPASDPVSIIVGNIAWQGWESVAITRSIEAVPASFSLIGTEKYPGPTGLSKVDILPGSPCQITLGGDTVITGYVDGRDYDLSADQHEVRVSGRSKLEDLVDCSGALPQQQSVGRTLGALANLLCGKLGISVSLPDGDTPTIPSITILLTETGYETLERVARWNARLLYDDTNGNLVIAKVGTTKHASGFQEGVNVQAVQSTLNVSERFTSIAAIWLDTTILSQGTDVSPLPYVNDQSLAVDKSFPARADGKPRYRPLLILAEQGQNQNNLVPQRVQWEMARRVGRSQAVTITCDSWRDSAGVLWTPNQLADISIPSCKVSGTWLISTVTYLRDAGGTRAEVTLMPPAAFVPQPAVAYTSDNETLSAAGQNTTGAQTPTQ